jgi:tRNA(fMet)-specific endonuclease VapC
MTGNKFLADTNIVIDLFKGDIRAIAFFEDQEKNIFIPATAIGELYLGAYRSGHPAKHLKEVEGFILQCAVLPVEIITAKYYGILKAGLLKKGKPIPENDMWIAASAMQHDLQLIARDSHFKEIDGLNFNYWE